MCTESESQEAIKLETPQPGGETGKKGLAVSLEEISRKTSAIMNDGRTSKELIDELYDEETGLPK